MNRRNFLTMAGGVGALVGVGAAATRAESEPKASTDDFIHRSFRVKWRDWMVSANQNVPIGMWIARHESKDLQWVSTSNGQCYPSRDWEVVDLTLARGWPLLTLFSSDADRAEAKDRARTTLLVALDECLRES